MSSLQGYHWPGNIRELQNVLEKAIVLTTGRIINKVDLPDSVPPVQTDGRSIPPGLSLRQWLNDQEKHYLLHQLKFFAGKIGVTAKNCGVDVKTLYRKMRLYGLDKKDN